MIQLSPFGLNRLNELTGGNTILDMKMEGYTADQAYKVLNKLGSVGRDYQMKYILPLDIFFPICYSMVYFMSITLITKKIRKNSKRPWLFGMIGLLPGIFDLTENVLIFTLLRNYPKHLNQLANTAGIVTRTKSILTTVSMLLIVIGLVMIKIKNNKLHKVKK
jgi:hypothetical protein